MASGSSFQTRRWPNSHSLFMQPATPSKQPTQSWGKQPRPGKKERTSWTTSRASWFSWTSNWLKSHSNSKRRAVFSSYSRSQIARRRSQLVRLGWLAVLKKGHLMQQILLQGRTRLVLLIRHRNSRVLWNKRRGVRATRRRRRSDCICSVAKIAPLNSEFIIKIITNRRCSLIIWLCWNKL